MSWLWEFIKKEYVVIIAGIAALISCALVPVTDYMEYIDTDVLGVLFSLMIIIAGMKGNNLLTRLSDEIISRARIEGTRKALVVVSLLTYFLSMFVTNDAALIALVPLTVLFFAEYPDKLIYAVVVQTVAANLGSMATPFGNPQNLLIFSAYKLTAWEFFRAAAPTALVGLGAVLILCLFMKDEAFVPAEYGEREITNKSFLVVYGILFVVTLLGVFGAVDALVVFASACVVAVIMEPVRLREVDYGLLATFVFFFIFVGNIRNIPALNDFVTRLVEGRELFASAAISQVVSNVPAALMLTEFTDNWKAVMLGTDIGGLGTPVASLASLISLRIYGETENAKTFKYLGVFLLINFAVLIPLYLFAAIQL